MNHRYRMPDRLKEREAEKLKRRFSNYLGNAPKKPHTVQHIRILVVLVVLVVFAAASIEH